MECGNPCTGELDEYCESCMDLLEKAATEAALNMGAAEHAWHPKYGKIIENGNLTEAGIQLFMDENKDL